ncbi:MAG: site-specific integrase [Candidatus Magnetoovum sp. WYHC-5]|nr:site-specific integrase [Candidatus Magnetoovum sp. WYHC-5]
MASSTYETAHFILNKFMEAIDKNRQVNTLKKRDMEVFVDYCRKIGNKPVTINTGIRQMKATFTKAVEWGYLKENPFKGYSLIKYQKEIPRYLTTEQIEKIFEVIDGNKIYRLLFAFYVYTGARRDEIKRLEWADVTADFVIIKKLKNYNFRKIPISGKLREVLAEYKKGVGKIFAISSDQLSHQFKHYFRKAGFGNIRLHDLRHTFASQLVMAGVELRAVQELLGHSDYATTLIYAHLSKEHLKKAIEKLPY